MSTEIKQVFESNPLLRKFLEDHSFGDKKLSACLISTYKIKAKQKNSVVLTLDSPLSRCHLKRLITSTVKKTLQINCSDEDMHFIRSLEMPPRIIDLMVGAIVPQVQPTTYDRQKPIDLPEVPSSIANKLRYHSVKRALRLLQKTRTDHSELLRNLLSWEEFLFKLENSSLPVEDFDKVEQISDKHTAMPFIGQKAGNQSDTQCIYFTNIDKLQLSKAEQTENNGPLFDPQLFYPQSSLEIDEFLLNQMLIHYYTDTSRAPVPFHYYTREPVFKVEKDKFTLPLNFNLFKKESFIHNHILILDFQDAMREEIYITLHAILLETIKALLKMPNQRLTVVCKAKQSKNKFKVRHFAINPETHGITRKILESLNWETNSFVPALEEGWKLIDPTKIENTQVVIITDKFFAATVRTDAKQTQFNTQISKICTEKPKLLIKPICFGLTEADEEIACLKELVKQGKEGSDYLLVNTKKPDEVASIIPFILSCSSNKTEPGFVQLLQDENTEEMKADKKEIVKPDQKETNDSFLLSPFFCNQQTRIFVEIPESIIRRELQKARKKSDEWELVDAPELALDKGSRHGGHGGHDADNEEQITFKIKIPLDNKTKVEFLVKLPSTQFKNPTTPCSFEFRQYLEDWFSKAIVNIGRIEPHIFQLSNTEQQLKIVINILTHVETLQLESKELNLFLKFITSKLLPIIVKWIEEMKEKIANQLAWSLSYNGEVIKTSQKLDILQKIIQLTVKNPKLHKFVQTLLEDEINEVAQKLYQETGTSLSMMQAPTVTRMDIADYNVSTEKKADQKETELTNDTGSTESPNSLSVTDNSIISADNATVNSNPNVFEKLAGHYSRSIEDSFTRLLALRQSDREISSKPQNLAADVPDLESAELALLDLEPVPLQLTKSLPSGNFDEIKPTRAASLPLPLLLMISSEGNAIKTITSPSTAHSSPKKLPSPHMVKLSSPTRQPITALSDIPLPGSAFPSPVKASASLPGSAFPSPVKASTSLPGSAFPSPVVDKTNLSVLLKTRMEN